MITSVAWIPRGVARARPVRFELSPEEYQRIKVLAKEEQELQNERNEIEHTYIAEEHLNDDEGDIVEEQEQEQGQELGEAGNVDISDLPKELRMDEYDEDDVDEQEGGGDLDEDDDEDEDAYQMIPEGDGAFAFGEDSDDEDAEDDEVRATDTLLAVAMTEDEYSHLEIQLFTEDGTLYVHHDISLPEFPLCLAWLDCPPYQSVGGGQSTIGNFMAVGTFNPAIEIWNLDILDPLEPTATLGGQTVSKKKKGKKKSTPTYKPGSHEGAVMSMSWNKSYRQILASGSADTSVKLWDVTTQICSQTFDHHRDKVQSVLWHPEESWMLASGSFDKTIAIIDCRNGSRLQPVPLPADIECLAWDPFQSNHLYCSLEDGQVMCVDIRQLNSINSTEKSRHSNANKAVILQFQAHDKTVSSLDFSSCVPGLCATSSIDETIKIWDMHSSSSPSHSVSSSASAPSRITPRNIFYKSMNVGNLFSINFSKDEPFLLATGGDGGIVAVWDCDEQQIIKDYFQNREKRMVSNPYTALAANSRSNENDLKLESVEVEELQQQEGELGEQAQAQGMKLINQTSSSGGGQDSEGKKTKKKKSKKKNT